MFLILLKYMLIMLQKDVKKATNGNRRIGGGAQSVTRVKRALVIFIK